MEGLRSITIVDCLREAAKYRSLEDFRYGSPTHYRVALFNDWIGEIRFLVPLSTAKERERSSKRSWTYAECWNEARRYESVEAFAKESPRAYAAAERKGWLNGMIRRPRSKRLAPKGPARAPNDPTDRIIKAASQCRSEAAMKRRFPRLWREAYAQGWLAEIRSYYLPPPIPVSQPKLERKPTPKPRWGKDPTFEQCVAVARQYASVAQFLCEEREVVRAAYKNGWLTKLVAYISPPRQRSTTIVRVKRS